MISCLLEHDRNIGDVSWNYSYEIAKRKEEGVSVKGFETGKYYSEGNDDSKLFSVIEKRPYELVIETKDESKMVVPLFIWGDGSESIILKGADGRERSITSLKEVSS